MPDGPQPALLADHPRIASFDFIVIGSGPAGRRAAIQAAKLGKSVLVVEKGRRVGGVSVHTGTIPSKTLRETVLNLSGWRERGFYGRAYRVKKDIRREDLMNAAAHDARPRGRGAGAPVRAQRRCARCVGTARFIDPHTIEVDRPTARTAPASRPSRFVIAVGTRPYRPDDVAVRRPPRARQRRDPRDRAAAAQPDRGRRRRDRHGIRHHLQRARRRR